MSAQVIPFNPVPTPKPTPNGTHRGDAPRRLEWDDGPALQVVSRSWDVYLATTICSEGPPEPMMDRDAVVSWEFRTDRYARSYAVRVYRDDSDVCWEFRGQYRPTDTEAQRARHDAIFRFVSELCAASYGIPA